MLLFVLSATEEIRLRVAAVTAALRAQATRRSAAPAPRLPPPVQLLLWGEPVARLIASPPRPQPQKHPARPAVAASVFDLARAPAKVRLCAAAEAPPLRISRAGDLVRVKRLQPQDTPEWQEQERARRARQRPPRPTKKARTRSKKFAALIGEGDHG